MWLKYRHKWAHGCSDWTWYPCDIGQVVEGDNTVEEFCEELTSKYRYSDKYRGIDYELHEQPPVEVVDKLIIRARENAESWQRRAEELKELRAKLVQEEK